jgi:hypothetical protein
MCDRTLCSAVLPIVINYTLHGLKLSFFLRCECAAPQHAHISKKNSNSSRWQYKNG